MDWQNHFARATDIANQVSPNVQYPSSYASHLITAFKMSTEKLNHLPTFLYKGQKAKHNDVVVEVIPKPEQLNHIFICS